MKMKKKIIKICSISILSIVILITLCFLVYTSNYYKAVDTDYFLSSTDEITISKTNDEIEFRPTNPKAGIIFYPGAKVEYEAYAPLMYMLCENDILCVIKHMKCNLAILDVNAANGYIKKNEGISNWYMAGHSMGGAMAASYMSKHIDDFNGLILLGAYTTKDLSEKPVSCLSIYGSNDEILNKNKYEENKANLPARTTEIIIDGGNHSFFGYYGEQKNDGLATITNEYQVTLTKDYILDYIF